MSDLLSGLPTVTMPVYAKDERGDFYPMTNAITWVKRDDVREALLAELDRLAAEEHTGPSDADRGFSLGWNYALAELRRAVTGGDDE